jgi:hypothetical protein
LPCTPFQDGASSLATSPRGSEMQCSSGHSPTPLAWPTGAKYYHQRWSLAGGGGVLRYVLVLNTHHCCCEVSKRAPLYSCHHTTGPSMFPRPCSLGECTIVYLTPPTTAVVMCASRAGYTSDARGEGGVLVRTKEVGGDEGARRQGQTRHTPEREVTSQPPSSSTLGYYSALQPGMCWCGHGRDSVGPIHHPPALPQHTPTPPGENPGSPCPTRHPNPPYTQLWSVTSHPPSSSRHLARVGLVLPCVRAHPSSYR